MTERLIFFFGSSRTGLVSDLFPGADFYDICLIGSIALSVTVLLFGLFSEDFSLRVGLEEGNRELLDFSFEQDSLLLKMLF